MRGSSQPAAPSFQLVRRGRFQGEAQTLDRQGASVLVAQHPCHPDAGVVSFRDGAWKQVQLAVATPDNRRV
jgi:hypothetical protein